MSHGYVTVQWNPRKKVYDVILWLGIALYLGVFMITSGVLHSGEQALSPIILMIRATSTLAFILLTGILCVGPLARLNTRFLPLLYNRRHLGVSMFFIALVHAALATIFYHGYGVINPVLSIFVSPGGFDTVANVPFQPFGFLALLILLVMAATSHDYWNKNLTASLWKAIHMAVYLAYALVVTHVAFGAMQDQAVGILPAMVGVSVGLVGGLHIIAGLHSWRSQSDVRGLGWVDVCAWQDIPNQGGISVAVNGEERVAIFRYDTIKLAAVANACDHQLGPLCEGRVIDGLITCPWHGFQYQPQDGRAPAPFDERLATYHLKLEGDRVLLNPQALPASSERPIIVIPGVIPSQVEV